MPLEQLFALPGWLLLGVFLGVCASVVVGGVFYLGDRFLDSGRPSRSESIDGSLRRRAEIREYLRTIGERFEEDVRLTDGSGGGPVAFYLPDRDVAITFDVRTYFELTETETYVVLCEYEMPATHLGRRLPFETPTVSPPPSVDESVSRAFDRLGLAPNADEAEIQAAYRDRIKQVHPDQGGSEAEFKRIQEAYTTARTHAAETGAS